jgi:hypothetical protein
MDAQDIGEPRCRETQTERDNHKGRVDRIACSAIREDLVDFSHDVSYYCEHKNRKREPNEENPEGS